MKLLFNLFLLYKSFPALALRFGLREPRQDVQIGSDGYAVTVAEHIPTDSETVLAAAGCSFALYELLT